MMTQMDIYWILRLDDIREVFAYVLVVTAIFSFVGLLFCIAVYCVYVDDPQYLPVVNILKKVVACFFVAHACSLMVYLFVPTTKDMVLIKVVPPIVSSEVAQRIPNDLTDLYNWAVKEIKAKAKEEVGK